jgi:hypothetical protein
MATKNRQGSGADTVRLKVNMKRILIMVFVLVGFALAGRGQTLPKVEDLDAYAVYAVVFSPEPDEKPAKPRRIVIRAGTSDYPRMTDEPDECLKPDAANEAKLRPLIDNYRDANKKASVLQRKFSFPFEYDLVPSEVVDGFFKSKGPGGWADFYKRFPNSGGYVEMSAVGFNSDKTLALLYAGHSCGGLCGGGSYHLLRKLDGKWTEINWPGTTCTWVS